MTELNDFAGRRSMRPLRAAESGGAGGGGTVSTRRLTEGEYRVGVNFNPSQNGTVDKLKAQAAAFIDTCLEIQQEAAGVGADEVEALADMAARGAEAAAMWAVKAATKPVR